ncbi:MAG: C69 family dipeptidase [Planctomycetota bacterium]
MKLEQDSFAKSFVIGFVVILGFHTFSYACDTWVAVGNSTKDGSVILGKNSDRPSVEAQGLKYFPRMKHRESKVKCTHITIPQAEETYAHIGSNIWWLFGYEIGMNEWGVAIGNEAEHSKEPYEKTGLLGMDLIRLALERAKTAYEAMHVITKLVAEHGQGGGCEYPGQWDQNATYHNSFIIADPNEAWVLESAGRYWVAKKVEDVWAISNLYSIEADFDEAHPDLIKHAIEMGWCRSEKDFNFARNYGDYTTIDTSHSQNRVNSNLRMLKAKKGQITVEYMMKVCRNHHEGTILSPRWSPNESDFIQTCMHDRPEVCPYRTAASMIAHLRKDTPPMLRQVYWQSFSSPCVNVFRPFYFAGRTIPDQFGEATNKYSSDSPWWSAEKIKRLCDLNYHKLALVVQRVFQEIERDQLERAKVIEVQALELINKGDEKKAERILQDFCNENVKRTAKEYKTLAKSLSRMVPVVGIDYLWVDFLQANCKTNALDLLIPPMR